MSAIIGLLYRHPFIIDNSDRYRYHLYTEHGYELHKSECQPTFYRPVENSEEIYKVLANSIGDALPDIISIIDPDDMQAVIKPERECPVLRRSAARRIIPETNSLRCAKKELSFPVTGLHTLGRTATERLVCLTFADRKEVLLREQQKITERIQKHRRWNDIESPNTEPHIPIAIAGGGLPESSLNEYAAERAGKDLFVVLGRLAVSPDARARSSKRNRKPSKTALTPGTLESTEPAPVEQTPSGITVVRRLPPNRKGIPAGLLQTVRQSH